MSQQPSAETEQGFNANHTVIDSIVQCKKDT